ncbi:MAG: 2-C-methyl-D-erythritol 2,4-cyclodiphosphate synthase [Actinobacteria bacterium]|nr:2-C-methyl-D-erythritol 2,4-cyclodiphosphate synthase [Actinomycetota bacterium]
MRVGFGYDVHAFDPQRALILGGVEVPDASGLAGWSDADVIAHAVADALLGAAALGDLGQHFPAAAVSEGASSLEILSRTARLLTDAGYRVVNVDATVIIQEVRVAPHREGMIRKVAGALGIEEAQVSVKATTTDHLGFAGRGEGAAAMAVALIDRTGSDVSSPAR